MYRLGLILILGILLAWSPGAPAQETSDPPPINFRSEAEVAGDYITLGHLAELPGGMAPMYGPALVWSAPPPGQIYTLTKEFLQYRLEQLGLKEILEGAMLPSAIRVRQTGVLLPADLISTAFRRYILEHSYWPKEKLRVEVLPQEEPVVLPDNQVTLEALPPKHGKLVGDVTLEMAVLRQGQPYKRIKVNGRVSLEQQVVCTTKTLRPHEVVGAGDVHLRRRDVSNLESRDFFTSVDQVIGRTLARMAGAEDILTSHHLGRNALIKKGAEVTVILDQDGLVITSKGVAQEEGHQGRAIKVLNPKSKKEFQAQVVDSKTVKVKL
ncbi:MAG: flagellar basal body P-ring formation chaperone FlgA [Thermodesulfobacteriota bacterium]